VSLANGTTLGRLRGTGSATRDAIVATLDGIDGLTGYPSAPEQATAGAAWPKWIQTTYGGHLAPSGGVDTWDVYAILPDDYAPTTVDEGDALRDLVAPELLRLGAIAYAEPVRIAFNENQTMPGIRLRMTTTR
jgi:hypothetical protein